MTIVILTAVGVGMSTVIGSLLSFIFNRISHKLNDAVLSFAAGIMLAATFLSLILPALDYNNGTLLCVLGIAAGAVLIRIMDKFVPHIHGLIGLEEQHASSKELNRVLLFLIAIAIHNFPEGMAVGVSFGGGDVGNAFSIAIGISLQNIPEGMITILPLLNAGVKKSNALLIALFTGSTEIIGVLIGYLIAGLSLTVLPFLLALAGGAMLYVISHDMIPETHSHGYENAATFSLIFGVMTMIAIDSFF